MYQTSLLLKLNSKPSSSSRLISNENGAEAKVKLAKQIQGAKYFEVHCDLAYIKSTLGVKCDLVDESQNFTNIESLGSDKVLERVKEATTMLLFKGGGYHNTIPISPSKSVINEFLVEVFPLIEKGISRTEIAETFIQVIIHHTEY